MQDLLVAMCELLVATRMRDLVPRLRIEPRPPALEVQSLTHWTTREAPRIFYFYFYLFIFDCIGSSLLRAGFLWLLRVGATLHCGARASHCTGFSCCRAWALGTWASVVVAHGPSCSVECGIFPDQGSNPCPLQWRVDS